MTSCSFRKTLFLVAVMLMLGTGFKARAQVTKTGDCPQNPGSSFDAPVNTVDVNSPIFTLHFWIDANTTYRIETTDLKPSSSADTVIRLFTATADYPSGVERGEYEVARDDDGGSRYASEITYTPSSDSPFVVVVHNYVSGYDGTFDLEIDKGNDGTVDWTFDDRPFGGGSFWNCGAFSGDKFQTRYEVGGADLHQMLLVAGAPQHGFQYIGNSGSSNDSRVRGRYGVNMVWNNSRAGNEYEFPLAYVSSYDQGDIGKDVTLVFNDLSTEDVWGRNYNDTDGDDDNDGLSNELENVLDTCPNALSTTTLSNGWNCDQTWPADTDNDGLKDAIEVFGYDHEENCWGDPDWNPYICTKFFSVPLRKFGANPRHKDVFVEVDYDEQAERDFEDGELIKELDSDYAANLHDAAQRGTWDDIANPDKTPGVAFHAVVRFTRGLGPEHLVPHRRIEY